MKTRSVLLLLLLLLVSLGLGTANAGGVFLSLPGIPGNSLNVEHPNEIEISSFSFGVSQTGIRAAGGRASAARSNFSVIALSKLLDSSSPQLFLKCALGQTIPTAAISFQTKGAEPYDFLIIKLANVVISSFQTAGTAGGAVGESVSLSYSTITYTFVPQNTDGRPGTPISVTFDVNRNKIVAE